MLTSEHVFVNDQFAFPPRLYNQVNGVKETSDAENLLTKGI